MRTIIENGTLVTSSDTYKADVLVEGETIVAIGSGFLRDGAQIIDASGCYVMPGAIDVHTHLDLLVGGVRAVDSFYSGTVAAACGGTTCVVDHMACGPEGSTLQNPIDEYHRLADGNAVIDYGFHGVLQFGVTAARLDELEHMVAEGIPSLKIYLTYPGRANDAEAVLVMERMKQLGGIVAVHCENHDLIEYLRRSLVEEGNIAPIYHAKSRPAEAEAEAVGRMLELAAYVGDAPLYIVHLSAAKSLKLVQEARARGQRNIFVETCPQYLTLTEDKYNEPDGEGLKYIMSPPLRTQEDCDYLWQGVRDGSIDVIATDHCPFFFGTHKQRGKDDFTKCPNGAPGLEERVRVIFSEGVMKGRIDLQKFVQVMCTNPAKIYGLFPEKGELLPGSHADILIMDPSRHVTITKAIMHSAVDYTAYEGMEIQGDVALVMQRGKVIAKDNAFLGQKGDGKYLQRHPVFRD